MRYARRLGLVGAVGFAAVTSLAPPAAAVEYRLQVVSLFDSAFVSFLTPPELRDGASGPGLDRLEASLEQGRMPKGAILFDRRVQPLGDGLVEAWGGARVLPVIKPAGTSPTLADEVAWEGNPGERAVWLVSPMMRNIQELYRVALKGGRPLRHFLPYTVPFNGRPIPAIAVPLNFLWMYEERGTIWSRYVSKSLDLGDGIGVVVGTNNNAMFPDQVYIVVNQGEQPTTYKAVLAWRERNVDREAPSRPGNMMRH
jgi:hypothetical protein